MTTTRFRSSARRRALTIGIFAGLVLTVWTGPNAAFVRQQHLPNRASSGEKARQTEAAGLRDYVVVKSAVDRSAVWIGDRFSFVVDIDCTHGTDILTDDLSRDRLQLQELDVVDVDETREDRGNGHMVYRFAYRLTTYSFHPPTKLIGEMRLRYYARRPGQRPEDIEPAGEIIVPGSMVVVRSLLPDDANDAKYRTTRPPVPRLAAFSLLQPIGIGLVVVSIVPAVFWALAIGRQWHHRRRRPSVRQLRHDERASLSDVRALDVETETGRREAFDRLSALVRQHMTTAWGVNANGLTPAEIAAALSAAGKGSVTGEAIAFLESCENARYGRSEELPARSACVAAIDQAGRLIGLGQS